MPTVIIPPGSGDVAFPTIIELLDYLKFIPVLFIFSVLIKKILGNKKKDLDFIYAFVPAFILGIYIVRFLYINNFRLSVDWLIIFLIFLFIPTLFFTLINFVLLKLMTKVRPSIFRKD